MAREWSDLPPDVVENIISRLPIHALCRARQVCKKWNHLIGNATFAALASRTPHILLTPRVLRVCRAIPESQRQWEILDITEKRLYSLSEHFIAAHLKRTAPCDFQHFLPCEKYTLAADQGLVYAVYFKHETRRHLVCNPVTRELHELPGPLFPVSYHQDLFLMLVDHTSRTYRIFTIQMYDRHYDRAREEIHVYESATRQWRHLCSVPGDLAVCLTHSCAFMHGALFALFFDLSRTPWHPSLYVCDLEAGSWTLLAVALPQMPHPHDKMQLVVSSDRLFLVEFCGLKSSRDSHRSRWEVLVKIDPPAKRAKSATIYEVLLAEKMVKKVAVMPEEYSREFDPVVAVALGESIVVSSLVAGSCSAFDLRRGRWHDPAPGTQHAYGTCVLDKKREFAGVVQLDLRKMEV